MDLKKYWVSTEGQDPDLDSMLSTEDITKFHPVTPIIKLRRNLLWNIISSLPILAFLFALFWVVSLWQFRLIMMFVTAFCVWSVVDSILLYRKIIPYIEPGNSVLEELKKQYNYFNNWMKLQQKAGLFFYPLSIIAGYILGQTTNTDKSIEQFMLQPKHIITLLIAELVLVPACYYLVKWLFQLSFGKQMKILKTRIIEIEKN